MKNVFLVAGLAVIGYAWYRQTHRAGGGTDVSTANATGSPSFSGGVADTSGGGAAGLAGSSQPLGVVPNMHALPAQRMSPDAGGTDDPGGRVGFSMSFHDMFN